MYEIFERLLAERKMTPYRVHKLTGISTATLSDWKSGKSTPKIDKLEKIAACLEVSVDYLRTGKSGGNVARAASDPLSSGSTLSELELSKAAIKLAKVIEDRDDLKRLLEYAKTLDPDQVNRLYQMIALMND